MKKRFYIFIAALLAVVIAIATISTISTRAYKNPKTEWTVVRGDESLFEDLTLNYELYVIQNSDHWSVRSTYGQEAEYDFSHGRVNYEAMISNNYSQNNGYMSYYDLGNPTTFEYYASIEAENYYEQLASQVPVGEENTFDPVVFSDIIDNYEVHLFLIDEENNMGEEECILEFPIGDEVLLTSTVGNYGDGSYSGYGKANYSFSVITARIGNNCYAIVAYEATETDDLGEAYDKMFTKIYLVSEDGETFLEEPVLVKEYDASTKVVDLFMVDGQAVMLCYNENGPCVEVIDEKNFETEKRFLVDADYGLFTDHFAANNYNDLIAMEQMLHIEDDLLYAVVLHIDETVSADEPEATSFIEIDVYHADGDGEPIAIAHTTNSLFTLPLLRRTYSTEDKGALLYNVSF